MKTLHVVPDHLPSDGVNSSGVKRSTITLIEGLRERGVEAKVLLPAPSIHDEDFTRRGFDIRYFGDARHVILLRQDINPSGIVAYACRVPGYAQVLRRVIQEWGVDLVHNQTSAFPVPPLVARFLGVPCVTHVRESGFRLGSIQNRLFLQGVPRLSDHVICCADYIRREFLAAGAASDKITTIYNAVNLRLFDGARDRNLRGELGIPATSRVVGCAGRIAPRKGIEYFIEAAASIASAIPDVIFLVVGDVSEPEEVPYMAGLREMANRYDLGHRLRFLGQRQDMPQVMGTLDVLVFTSPNDIGPRVPIEAMAAGTPVVSASEGGAQEEVVDGLTGVQVEPRNVPAIASAVLRLLRDDALRHRLGSQAAGHVRQHYAHEKHVDAVIGVYNRVLDRKRRAVADPSTMQSGS